MSSMNLRSLPKTRDSWSYLYVDKCRIDVEAKAIAIQDVRGSTPVPIASITLLMLGPGSTITHAAVRALADNGCLITWTGEHAVRFYAMGSGETRSAKNLYRQVARWADPVQRLDVAKALYKLRFDDDWNTGFTLQQLRGMEGARVRDSYALMSEITGVPWFGMNRTPFDSGLRAVRGPHARGDEPFLTDSAFGVNPWSPRTWG